MKLTVLGKYGPYPQKNGACSAYLVENADTHVMLDFGAGAYARLLDHLPVSYLQAIALSHLHADHMSDTGVLQYAVEQGRALSPFPIFAPRGCRQLDVPSFRYIRIWDGAQTRVGTLTLTFHTVNHVGESYAIGVSDDEGKRIFYTGDTSAFPALAGYARDCDLLLADACLLEPGDADTPRFHMTAAEAGQLSRDANAKRTVLTHIWGGGVDEASLLLACGQPNCEIAVEGRTYEV